MLSRDKKNIQLLTCFSIENVINGLLLLLQNVFSHNYELSTILLHQETAEVIDKQEGFCKELVFDKQYSDNPVLFEIKIQGRGTILMDMF